MIRRDLGFTLVEMMVVVAITGLLASIAVPEYQKYTDRTRMRALELILLQSKTYIDTLALDAADPSQPYPVTWGRVPVGGGWHTD